MPICTVCQTFFVRPQSFKTLFSFNQMCTMCETLLNKEPTLSVLPLDYNTLEVLTYNHEEHPALTQKYFHYQLRSSASYLYYQTEWENHPESLILLGKLFSPLKLFYHHPIEQKIFNLLEN